MRKFTLFVCAVAIAFTVCEVLTRELIVVRDVGPSFCRYDPLLGKAHKARFTTSRQTPEFTMRFTTNSLGYRGPEPAPYETADEPVVLCLGDSFTEGYGVNDGEEFPRLLDAALTHHGQHVRTINAGVGDTGTGRALQFLRAYGTTIDATHPTVLVYQVAANDFSDDEAEGFFTLDDHGLLVERIGEAPRSTLRKLQPILENVPGLSYSYFVAAALEAVKLHASAPRVPAAARAESASTGAGEFRLTAALEDALLRVAKQRGWPAVVLTVGLSPTQRSTLAPVFGAHAVSWLDIPSKDERPDLYYRVDGHWTAAGHEYIAARLLPAVEGQLAMRHSPASVYSGVAEGMLEKVTQRALPGM